MLTKDVPKWKFLAETEQNEALGPKAEYWTRFFTFFPMYFASFFHHYIIAQPNCAFYCFVLCFKEKNTYIIKQQFKNVYLTLNLLMFNILLDIIPTKHNLT